MRFFEVDIIESERGWGSKVDETKYFVDEQKAKNFVKEYNSRNNLPYVPDWYMRAENPRIVDVSEELVLLILANLTEDIKNKAGIVVRKKAVPKKKAKKTK